MIWILYTVLHGCIVTDISPLENIALALKTTLSEMRNACKYSFYKRCWNSRQRRILPNLNSIALPWTVLPSPGQYCPHIYREVRGKHFALLSIPYAELHFQRYSISTVLLVPALNIFVCKIGETWDIAFQYLKHNLTTCLDIHLHRGTWAFTLPNYGISIIFYYLLNSSFFGAMVMYFTLWRVSEMFEFLKVDNIVQNAFHISPRLF